VDASGIAGAALTFQNSTASDTLVGGQGVHLVVNNTSGGARTVTITTPETVRALAVAEQTISVAVGIKVIPVPAYYNDPGSGQATITVDTPGATCQYAAFQGSAAA
jgi:hypothetical protein